jgi:two-component system response regulator PhcR
MAPPINTAIQANTVLFVDDEPLARKWFTRTFQSEFGVLTAGSADEALQILIANAHDIAIVVTDYRMPGRNGLQLLEGVRTEFRHVVRLLMSAFAEKDMAIAAINSGCVFRLLEKPMDQDATRMALREALAVFRNGAHEQALHESRAAATQDTLGFVAHELNTPIAIVRGYLEELGSRLRNPGQPDGMVMLSESKPGQISAMLKAAEKSAFYCTSLLSTFVQSARDAYPGSRPQPVTASSILKSVVDEYPFSSEEQRGSLCTCVETDFLMPGRRDLVYLVLCTLTKNALQALHGQPEARLVITAGMDDVAGSTRQWMRFQDNGPGIDSELLSKLSKEPVKSGTGGSGMGLVFCRRVVQSMGGSIEITSKILRGTTVTLYFNPLYENFFEEATA